MKIKENFQWIVYAANIAGHYIPYIKSVASPVSSTVGLVTKGMESLGIIDKDNKYLNTARVAAAGALTIEFIINASSLANGSDIGSGAEACITAASDAAVIYSLYLDMKYSTGRSFIENTKRAYHTTHDLVQRAARWAREKIEKNKN